MRQGTNTAETIQLQRQKFYDVANTRQEQGDDAANQLAMLYDIVIAKKQSDAELTQFDKETRKLEVQAQSAEDKFQAANQALAKAKIALKIEKNRVEGDVETAISQQDPNDLDAIERISSKVREQGRRRI